jgi:hypothetical protein
MQQAYAEGRRKFLAMLFQSLVKSSRKRVLRAENKEKRGNRRNPEGNLEEKEEANRQRGSIGPSGGWNKHSRIPNE